MKTISPGPYQAQPLQSDHGASLAIVDSENNVLAIIPPLNEDDSPDMDSAIRGPHDEGNAELFARSFELLSELTHALEVQIDRDEESRDYESETLKRWAGVVKNAGGKDYTGNFQDDPDYKADHAEKIALMAGPDTTGGDEFPATLHILRPGKMPAFRSFNDWGQGLEELRNMRRAFQDSEIIHESENGLSFTARDGDSEVEYSLTGGA